MAEQYPEYVLYLAIPMDAYTSFLVHVGWHDDRRIYGCILHLDIKDGKIWLQHNGTENDIPAELVEMGVAKTNIVIGFHSPFKRQFTEYAVG